MKLSNIGIYLMTLLLLSSCGSSIQSENNTASSNESALLRNNDSKDTTPPPRVKKVGTFIYGTTEHLGVNHDSRLYQVNMDTFEKKYIGKMGAQGIIQDITFDREDRLLGIGYSNGWAIFSIDTETAATEVLFHLDGGLANGITWAGLATMHVPSTNADILIGAREVSNTLSGQFGDYVGGHIYIINTTNDLGSFEQVIELPYGHIPIGDVEVIDGDGIFVTVRPYQDTFQNSRILKYNENFELLWNVETSLNKIAGLAECENRLYGFSYLGKIVEINPETGAAELLNSDDNGIYKWEGAAANKNKCSFKKDHETPISTD